MCWLMPFLLSCPFEIYLQLKQAGRGGQECLFSVERMVTGPRLLQAAPVVAFSLHPDLTKPFKNTCNLQFLILPPPAQINHKRKAIWVQICVCLCVPVVRLWAVYVLCADDCPTHRSAIEHGLIKIAHTGLNPQLGNELQLQRMKSNYINCLPVDGALLLFLS